MDRKNPHDAFMNSLHFKQSDWYTLPALYLSKVKYEESTYTDNKAMNSQTRDLFFFHAGFLFCQAKAREVSSKAKKGDWRLIGAMLETKHQFIHELIPMEK